MSELTQLRDYCDYLDEIQGEIDLFDAVPAVQPVDRFDPKQWVPRGVLVAAAAAVVVLVLVGGLAWVTRWGQGEVVNEPTTTLKLAPGGEVTTVATLEGVPDRSQHPRRPGGAFVDTGDAVWLRTIDRDGNVLRFLPFVGRQDQWYVVRVDKASGEVERIPIMDHTGKMVATADALWVNQTLGAWPRETHRVVRIDLVSRTITDSITVPDTGDLFAADGGLWVSGPTATTRIDLTTRTVDSFPFSAEVWIGEIGGGLWASNGQGTGLVRVDLDTRQTRPYSVGVGGPDWGPFLIADDAIWVAAGRALVRLDPESGNISPQTATLPNSPTPYKVETRVLNVRAGAFSDGAIWVTDSRTGVGTVTRIDAANAAVTDVIAVPSSSNSLSGPNQLLLVGNSLWAADNDGTMSHIDTTTRQITHAITIGEGELLLVAEGAVWAAANDGTITRTVIDP